MGHLARCNYTYRSTFKKLIYKGNAKDKLSWIVEFPKIMISSYLKQEHKRIARITKAAMTP